MFGQISAARANGFATESPKTFFLFAWFCTLCCGTAGTLAAERPNILLILPDQMRASAMGCDGNTDVKTPNIDGLAAEGVRFKQTYANVPVCCPARAILLTGTYPHINGMVANDLRLREEHVTISEILAQAGYRTGFVGKWHLDGGPRDPGFVPPGPRRQGFEFWAAYECHHKHFEPVCKVRAGTMGVVRPRTRSGRIAEPGRRSRASRTSARPRSAAHPVDEASRRRLAI